MRDGAGPCHHHTRRNRKNGPAYSPGFGELPLPHERAVVFSREPDRGSMLMMATLNMGVPVRSGQPLPDTEACARAQAVAIIQQTTTVLMEARP